MAEHWMQKAFAKNKNSFTRSAEKAGMSVQKFAKKETAAGSKASTTMKRRANLAKVAQMVANKHKRKA